VDFRDPGRRREARGFAKSLARIIRDNALFEEGGLGNEA
jgi:hypothetical protein